MKHAHALPKILTLCSLLFSHFVLASPAQAQDNSITIRPLTPFSSVQQAIDRLVPIILFGGAFACFIYIVWGAYKYLTAGDNAANTAAARQTIINAIVGLVLLSLTFIIWRIVVSIVGLDSLFSGASS